ncbi:MAG: hypothetical protein ACRDV9_07275 [Acidimicrobiia bacterium]
MSAPVRFTEEMKGFCTFGTTDHRAGWKEGKASSTSLMFHLTISVDDLGRFRADPLHGAQATGWIRCQALSSGNLPVTRGVFNLFVPGKSPGRTTMRYRLWFSDGAGRPLTLVGFKDIGDDPGLDLWSDTTSLATSILDGHVDEGDDSTASLRARGVLVIRPLDFAKQITTFRGPPAGVAGFAWLFMKTLWHTYRTRTRRSR